jgi:hypothetical protein
LRLPVLGELGDQGIGLGTKHVGRGVADHSSSVSV